ncbi:MAG: hypothetical protein ABIR37_02300 [Candidatus Saccharimonadales bacterium]
MSEISNHPHSNRVLHGSMFVLFVAGVGFAADKSTGGYDAVMNRIQDAKASAFGLRNINLNDTKLASEAASVGTATSGCLDLEVFSTDRVQRISRGPDTFRVMVRKIGEGALNPADVQECVFAQTGLRTSVIEEK